MFALITPKQLLRIIQGMMAQSLVKSLRQFV